MSWQYGYNNVSTTQGQMHQTSDNSTGYNAQGAPYSGYRDNQVPMSSERSSAHATQGQYSTYIMPANNERAVYRQEQAYSHRDDRVTNRAQYTAHIATQAPSYNEWDTRMQRGQYSSQRDDQISPCNVIAETDKWERQADGMSRYNTRDSHVQEGQFSSPDNVKASDTQIRSYLAHRNETPYNAPYTDTQNQSYSANQYEAMPSYSTMGQGNDELLRTMNAPAIDEYTSSAPGSRLGSWPYQMDSEGTTTILNQNQKRQLMDDIDTQSVSTDGSSQPAKKQRVYEGEPPLHDPNVLWLGGLGNLIEPELRQYFTQYGNITKVSITERQGAIGFGSITFESPDQVQLALEGGFMALPGLSWSVEHTIGSEVIACHDSKLRSESRILFLHGVKNLQAKQLKKYFLRYGKIENVNVGNRNGAKGYGFIKFNSPISCAKACSSQRRGVSTHHLEGIKFFCQLKTSKDIKPGKKKSKKAKKREKAMQKREKKIMQLQENPRTFSAAPQPSQEVYTPPLDNYHNPDGNTLLVYNLEKLEQRHLYNYFFSKYGPIKNINIKRDSQGLSTGYGYVTFQNPSLAEKAYQDGFQSGKSQHRIQNTTIECRWNLSAGEECIIIKGVRQLTIEDLTTYLNQYGEIKQIVPMGDSALPSVVAHYTLPSQAEAVYQAGIVNRQDGVSKHAIKGVIVVMDLAVKDQKAQKVTKQMKRIVKKQDRKATARKLAIKEKFGDSLQFQIEDGHQQNKKVIRNYFCQLGLVRSVTFTTQNGNNEGTEGCIRFRLPHQAYTAYQKGLLSDGRSKHVTKKNVVIFLIKPESATDRIQEKQSIMTVGHGMNQEESVDDIPYKEDIPEGNCVVDEWHEEDDSDGLDQQGKEFEDMNDVFENFCEDDW